MRKSSGVREYSGWRGGIGIAFGSPSRWIPDVMELGYEIAWGIEDDPGDVGSVLDVAMFRYWNSIVEVTLKDPGGRYDFSSMENKVEAASLAFDAWAEGLLGQKGLSRYATVEYRPEGSYGDVMGTMDYSTPNPLVGGLMETYLRWFEENRLPAGGIALDNAGKVPRVFLETLRERFRARGLGIATNGCPDELLPLVDFFGNEGFPFGVARERDARSKGFRGILGEFTMQHLSGGELEAYLKARLFNRIVFFGYTNGGTAAGAAHSFYVRRPDVYEHQRWAFRKYVSLSRAVVRAGEREAAHASFAARGEAGSSAETRSGTRADGAVFEWNRKHDVRALLKSSMGESFVRRFGDASAGELYLYVGSATGGRLRCDAAALGLPEDTVVWDEFGETLSDFTRRGGMLEVELADAPALLQLGRRSSIVASMLARIGRLFEVELRQRAFDRLGKRGPALEPWRSFCDGYALDSSVARSGGASLRLSGGERATYNGKFRYHSREGAAQIVDLGPDAPAALTLRAWSRSDGIPRSDPVPLSSPGDRDRHFSAREGGAYTVHLYLDCQDGSWPDVASVSFTAGTHDWEERSLTVRPSRSARTALVLVELHQSSGRAWFDDLELTRSDRPGDNLLLFGGFEADAELERVAAATEEEYDRQLQAIGAAIGTATRVAAGGSVGAAAIRELAAWVAGLQRRLQDRGLARLWSYESRDLVDAGRRLEICLRILEA